MEDIIIRETLPEDAEKIIEYIKKVGGETDNLTFGKEGLPITLEQEREYLQQMRESRHSVHYSVWKDGEMIGDASLKELPRRMSHRADMGLSVVKAEWNKGIGSRLLDKMIEYARQNEIEIINLEVRSDNTGAIHLYEKYGFKHIGTMPAFFKIGNSYFDFEVMYLDLR
ncbi:MAG: GNAT family N-acetyltransferase [Dorea sp.]|nr:GNAT family N-acetyltransferase [Dorea sp.]